MKHLFLKLGILFIISSCAKNQGTEGKLATPKPTRSWSEVISIADQYGISEFITEKNASGFAYLSESDLHAYLKDLQPIYLMRKEEMLFTEKASSIKSASEYFQLIESYPLVKNRYFETDEQYRTAKSKIGNNGYEFYLNKGHPYLLSQKIGETQNPVDGRALSNN